MALISASTILTSLCLFHITLAYFFFTNPHVIADQALVWVLGEAMKMPQTQLFLTPSPTSSLLAVMLFVLGLSDLISLSMPQEIWLVHYWGTQAPARIVIFGGLALFAYLTAPPVPASISARLHHPASALSYLGPAYGTASGSDGLRNRVFLTLACLEVLSWFWAWVTLREEAAAFAVRKRKRASSSAKP
ncbi:increased loss of mitochondrial DNA protein 1 [Xylaria sp. CBS 124048]|nr:increased loss of mitochondrial DNA protein 1 [Xylaria sp. CBS 124048]